MAIDETAPVITRDQIEVNAPIDRVWAIQTDIDSWTEWRPTVTAARLDGELAAGSTFDWSEAGLEIVSTIAAVDAPRRIEWGGPALGIIGTHVWELTSIPSGTLVRTEESWSGPPVEEAVDRMQTALDAAIREWLTRLKARAES